MISGVSYKYDMRIVTSRVSHVGIKLGSCLLSCVYPDPSCH